MPPLLAASATSSTVLRAADTAAAGAGNLTPDLERLAREVIAGSPATLEVLGYFARNPGTLLPAASLAARIARHTDAVAPALAALVDGGFLREMGGSRALVLDRSAERRAVLDSLRLWLEKPGGRERLLGACAGSSKRTEKQ